MGFGPFLGFANQHRSAYCTDSMLLGLQAQLQSELSFFSFCHGCGSLRTLGDYLALLFCERGIDVKCKGVAIAPEGGDY